MSTVPVGPRFDEGRMLILSDGGNRFSDLVAHLSKVHAIHDRRGNVVAFCAINNLLERSRAFHGCTHGEKVIFADENDRQFVEGGEIQCFVKSALIDRAISEKTKGEAVFVSVLAGESQPAGERDVRADNRMPAVHVMSLIEKMHRSAQTAGATSFLAEKFGHASIGRRPTSEGMGVVAICSDQVIIVTNRCDRASHDGLLSNIEMTEPADFLRLILLTRTFLKTPNEQHQPEHLDFVALLRRRHGGHPARATANRSRARARAKLRTRLMQRTNRSVKKRLLTTELRKNIQVGVALYCGSPTVSA